MELLPMLILGATGLVAAILLFVVAKAFAVKEDERIAQVEAILPGANCGACGRKGCHDFAVACCEATSLEGLRCPGAGDAGMKRIGDLLGFTATTANPKKAFVACNGTTCNRLVKRDLSAIKSCQSAQALAYPAGYCTWGCLGCGDCVVACRFEALTMDAESGLPKVNYEACTGCGACASACPQGIIKIHELSREGAFVMVRCSNHDKGGAARKMCAAACIGCGKCARTCQHAAITLVSNLAVIDQTKCVGCGECVAGCPTKAINKYFEE